MITGDDSVISIGSACKLNALDIRSFQVNDFIAVGNNVTTTAKKHLDIWESF